MLSKSEKIRAAGYKFELDRTRFITRRGILRILLGRYLNQSPDEVSLYTNPEGKLENGDNEPGFNLSHSGDQIAYVFGKQKNLGIDIEQVKPLEDLMEIAERFFSPFEKSTIHKLSGDNQLETFYHIWTQKEAFVKAIGTGLSENLRDFNVSPQRERPGWLINSQDARIKHWRIWTFKFARNFRGAICFPSDNLKGIRVYHGSVKTDHPWIDIASRECEKVEILT